ncbi:DUF2797 domain-containing protein [Ningiella sp. W23]|uniref:DUF2797 domain-containing protein n=1 Tax=Ningiella sp. W23 TaxID=3023715 RepID=UPI003757C201
MANYAGTIKKMQVSTNDHGVAQYQLPIGSEEVDVNALVGSTVSVVFTNRIECVHCQRPTKKSFNQGYCYPCLMRLAQCDSCIIKPELCHYQEGTCREPEWGEAHCLQNHFVYLANTGAAKVGITRHAVQGVSSRWIDQGASQALPIFRVSERKLSGLLETTLAKHISDKTNWRVMLKGQITPLDLSAIRDELLSQAKVDIDALTQEYGLQAISPVEAEPVAIDYPVERYPEKIKSINLDKTSEFSGVLNGIKGQYWLLDEDRVINIRKYSGYEWELSVQ